MTGRTLVSFSAQGRIHKDPHQTSSFEKCTRLGTGAQMQDSCVPIFNKCFVPAKCWAWRILRTRKSLRLSPGGSCPEEEMPLSCTELRPFVRRGREIPASCTGAPRTASRGPCANLPLTALTLPRSAPLTCESPPTTRGAQTHVCAY